MTERTALEIVAEIVVNAGRFIHRLREQGKVKAWTKPDGSPSTNADVGAQRFLQEELKKHTPSYGFIGEESPGERGKKYTWICDPIDGTRSYRDGGNRYVVSLALQHEQTTIGGIIYNPETEELFTSNSLGARCRGTLLRSGDQTKLWEARLRYALSETFAADRERITKLQREKSVRKAAPIKGSVAYLFAEAANKECEAFLVHQRGSQKIWDYAAGVHLLESTGGKATDLEGRTLAVVDETTTIIAARNQLLHKELLDKLKEISFGKISEE